MEFNIYGFAVAILVFICSTIYTYLIRKIILSRYEEKIKNVSPAQEARAILKTKDKNIYIGFSFNFFKLEIDKYRNRINVLQKFSSEYTIYSLIHFTFLAYLYPKKTKLNCFFEYLQKALNVLIFVNILWLSTFNLWIIALSLFGFIFIFNLIIIIANWKKVNQSLYVSYEKLKYLLTENEYALAVNLLKKYKYYELDKFLNSGISPFVEMISSFNQWGK
ncbi:hypothetical protein [Mycoplasmopsis alligatoris]|uniref:Uncharacterized protein n=1 Tax=Mycoplasmopsis alligatoris A21JP2 TaxID=747682 RepID=D4XWX6_9BACT|nr:hypothetical protein [Mycoplasmopsis alligatoris]EFF41149.1 hypothetical protein MALL_0288 [Mycoplasmopsis alligatoris A21JP2]